VEQQAVVVAVHGARARVRAERRGACGQCAGQRACGTLGAWRERVVEVEVDNVAAARVGDWVVVQLPDGVLLRATMLVYGLPMLMFIAAGLLGHALAPWLGVQRELGAVALAFVGLGASFLWLRHTRLVRRLPRGEIVRVLRARVAMSPGS